MSTQAEIGRTPFAREKYAEVTDGLRIGFSPGFWIESARFLTRGEPGFDPEKLVQTKIESWGIFELSSTSIPRNSLAIVTGRYKLSLNANKETREIKTTDDLMGLGLMAARLALDGGSGTKAQRQKLTAFFASFDALQQQGRSRDQAAKEAGQEVGIL